MEPGPESVVRCRLCHAAGATVIAAFPLGQHSVVAYACPDCKSLFHLQDDLADAAYAQDYHAYHAFQWLSPKTVLLGKKAAGFLLRHRGPPGSLFCDIGCGAGHVLRTARALGHRVVGHDIPSPAVAAMQADGLEIITDPKALQTAYHGRCDRLTCWHTLEHVRDPHAFLDFLVDLLAPGAWLSLEVPEATLLMARVQAAGSESFRRLTKMPEHITLCAKDWLVAEVARRGLAVEAAFAPADGAFYALADRCGYWTRAPAAAGATAAAPDPAPPVPSWSFPLALAGLTALALEPLAPLLAPRSSVHIRAQKPR